MEKYNKTFICSSGKIQKQAANYTILVEKILCWFFVYTEYLYYGPHYRYKVFVS